MIRVTPPTTLNWEGNLFKCVLGRNGVTSDKWEGDGFTPAGTYALRKVLYRRDRVAGFQTTLPTHTITKSDAWCDDPEHEFYNMPVQLPIEASHEKLWRNDPCYDIVVVLGHNDAPVVPYRGSAIFMHVATADHSPTEGCVALEMQTLVTVLAGCDPNENIHIQLTT